MKMWTKLFLLAALVGGVVALSQAFPQTPSTSIAGTWEGKLDGLPGVKLAVSSKNGNVTGNVTFYLIKHNPDGSNPHVDGQSTGPIEHTRLNGNTLTFEVSRADGSVVKFRMELKSENQARLFRTNDNPPSPEGQGLELDRVR